MDNIILKIVAEAYGITVSHILSKNKKGKIPEARRMVVLFLNIPNCSPTKVANSVNRERCFYYFALKKIAFELQMYKEVTLKFKPIKMSLLNYLKTTKQEQEAWLINNPCQDQPKRGEIEARLADINETYEYIINL